LIVQRLLKIKGWKIKKKFKTCIYLKEIHHCGWTPVNLYKSCNTPNPVR